MTEKRCAFGVINLPLTKDLVCGPITLSPIPEGQEELEKRRSYGMGPVVSAEGFLPIPEGVDPWGYVREQPILAMELLLSFAERRFIETTAPELQTRFGDAWQWAGMHSHRPLIGDPYGVAWHHGHAHLQEFIDRCLPIVADAERGERSGLRLALLSYRSNFRQDYVEIQYLRTWQALEILYTQHLESNSIMSKDRFRRVSRAIRRLLGDCREKGFIDEIELALMQEKLSEINRLSARHQSLRFFEYIFRDHPAQVVTEEDMRKFVRVRNDITHGGVMRHNGEEDYGDVLNQEHGRLQALLERVFLAMMGQDANLLTFSWKSWLFGA